MDPRRLLPALTAVAGACVVATLVVRIGGPGQETAGAGPRPATGGSAVSAPAQVLAGWDRRRSTAWAAGDAAGLRRLYAAGSRAGAADVRHLRAWLDRGLRVEGLQTQVLRLEVATRTPDRLALVVTDRVVGGRAVGGEVPVALPSDRASTRLVELVRVDGRWLVEEVRDQDSAAETTSWTSSSSKS